MPLKDRVLAYQGLGDSLMIVRAIFDEAGVDFEKEVSRLNGKAPALGAGTMLREGARDVVDRILRDIQVMTPKGPVRGIAFASMTEPAAKVFDQELSDVQAAVQAQYAKNAEERKAGAFAHILDYTVGQISQLASKYRSIAKSYYVQATRYEWLVDEAVKRGLGENDTLRKAFTEEDLTEMSEPETVQAELSLLAQDSVGHGTPAPQKQ